MGFDQIVSGMEFSFRAPAKYNGLATGAKLRASGELKGFAPVFLFYPPAKRADFNANAANRRIDAG